jgi:hypothetical protein
MKTITSVMVLSIGATALSACTTVKVLDGVKVHCPASPAGKITAKDGELSVNDNMIKICRGDSVQFTFKNALPPGTTAETSPKNATNPAHNWLGGMSRGGQPITLTVPLNTPVGEYGYTIEVMGIGRLDPRFVVQ